MARVLLSSLLVLLIAGAALLLGLTGFTLQTGRIDPLDWLIPGLLALIAPLLIERRGLTPGRLVSLWALVTLPAALFLLIAAARAPWSGLLILAAAFAFTAVAAEWVLNRPRTRWPALVLLCLAAALGRWALLPGAMPTPSGGHPLVGVVTALPLYGPALAEAEQGDPLAGAGRVSPLWQMLRAGHDPRPLDHLDAASLAPFRRLLIAQPRQLAPDELVALDAWVRGGGHALILADPLLHWPDPRPLGHARRAPLTSLLDPLLTHWGLRLEAGHHAVDGDPVIRRLLDGGALLQMAGTSRFTLTSGTCQLEEAGLIARCTLGQGSARLIADADWINDTLWTLDSARPQDRAAWTSDTIPALASWLRPGAAPIDSPENWLIGQDRLIIALRAALALLLAQVMVHRLVARRPMIARRKEETNKDHNWNKVDTIGMTG